MSYETDDNMVSHPDHYKSGKYEVIDIIDEFTKDLTGTEAVCTGNAIKYVLRWKKKNGVQDVKKAIWYLTHLVEHLEEKENPGKPHSVIIHKMNNGHYAIKDVPDEEEKEEQIFAPCADESGLSVSKIISGMKDNGCAFVDAGTDEEKKEDQRNKKIEEFVESLIDEEKHKLCAENHINPVGICVPDSQPWDSKEVK